MIKNQLMLTRTRSWRTEIQIFSKRLAEGVYSTKANLYIGNGKFLKGVTQYLAMGMNCVSLLMQENCLIALLQQIKNTKLAREIFHLLTYIYS